MAHIAVRELCLNARQVVDCNGHVLVFGQPVELSGNGTGHVELEAPRLIKDERADMAGFDGVSFAPGLHRPEEIVEVGSIPADTPSPVVSSVFGVEMQALLGGHIGCRRVARRQREMIELQRV